MQRAPHSLQDHGFTLVELLISVLLLTLMLTIASVALRNLLMSMERISTPYPQKAISFYRLQSMIQGMYPYVVLEKSRSAFKKSLKPGFFFQGAKDECIFITLSPLKTGEPSICRIYKMADRVLLDEGLLYSPESDFMVPAISGSGDPVVLFEGITELSFSYEYKMNDEETELYSFPATITMVMKDDQGYSIKNVFVVRSNFHEKIRMILLLQDNV